MNVKHAIVASTLALAGVAAPNVATAQSELQVLTERLFGERGSVHVANDGDTLFMLAAQYLGDPLAWPLLWSFNPQISNPHWIYPGDVVFVQAPEDPEASLQLEPTGNMYQVAGFYAADDLVSVGELKFANTARRLLSEHDDIFLEFDDPSSVRVGDLYAINRVINRVYADRRERELVAVQYTVNGMVEVTAHFPDTDLIQARIVQLWDTIERGDVLFAGEPQLQQVAAVQSNVDLEAEIIDVHDGIRSFHEQNHAFVNRGADDGVQVGNRFLIWDRQDEAAEIALMRQHRADYQEDVVERLPWENVGEALVVHVTQGYSTVVITRAATRELETGMRLTMQRGY